MSQCSADEEKTRAVQTAATAPHQDRRELLIALAVFMAALLYLWPLRDFLSFNADEGITLASAERILRGQVPYRDFFTLVTPGSSYLMALWFKLFGTTYVVARTVLLLYAGTFGALTYRLARRVSGRSAALFAAALLISGCMPSRFLVLHNWNSTFFALLALYFAQLWLEAPGYTYSFLLGCATALTILTEQSKGAGLVLGLGIAALALWLSDRSRFRVSIRKLWAGVAGFAIPVAITFAYFGSQHATKVMLEDWLWPLRHYSAVNRLPYGALPVTVEDLRSLFTSGSWGVRAFVLAFSAPMVLVSVLALLVIAATFYAIALRRKSTPQRPALDARVLGGCIFLGVFLSTLSTGRADLNHMLYLAPLFMYLVPSAFEIHYRGARLFGKTKPIAAGLLLISFLGFGMSRMLKAATAHVKIQTRRGVVRVACPDEVLAYIQKNVPERQHLYVHPYQALYSFMSATVNPARIIFLFPGLNTPDQYAATIGDLAADRTPYVLLNPDFANMFPAIWPSTPAEAVAYDPVADYILKHYRTCQVLNSSPQHVWRFYFMVRADLSCPASR